MKHFFISILCLAVLCACNTDNDLTAPEGERLTVSFENKTGVYEVKVGRTITVTPQVNNAVNPRYRWTDDLGQTVGSELQLRFSSQTEGAYYFTFTVNADNGSAHEEIRIDVLDMVMPTVTLPSTMQTTVGSKLVITPAVSTGGNDNATYSWSLDGKEVGTEPTYTFPADSEGEFRLRLTVTNEDGSGSAEMTLRVTARPQLAVSFPQTSINLFSGQSVSLFPTVSNAAGELKYEWSVDGHTIDGANGPTLDFTPTSTGQSDISVTVTELPTGTSATASIAVNTLTTTEDQRFRPASATSSPDRITVYEFMPAPSQFVHQIRSITMADACLEAQRRINSGQELSLGGFGGYIIVGFDHSVARRGSSDYDFAIAGNSFKTSNEPGIVWVMQDTNGNGLPDDTWYELRGSESGKPQTLSGYSVTYYRPATSGSPIAWADSRNLTGIISLNPIWPSWQTASSYTLSGTCLEPRIKLTTQWELTPYDYGYVDNLGSDMADASDNPDARANYNRFRISDAMSASGAAVSLRYIDFIKVQSGVNASAGILGEVSTEILGFRDCAMTE